MEVKRKLENTSLVSPTSSPPTPPSPLPISVGPGNRKYNFSPSPSSSPPFSPPTSSHGSAELLPLLQEKLPSPRVPAAFSLDLKVPDDYSDSTSSCLKDLLEWFVERCCNACSTTAKSTRNLLSDNYQRQKKHRSSSEIDANIL